eukprot:g2310.t1
MDVLGFALLLISGWRAWELLPIWSLFAVCYPMASPDLARAFRFLCILICATRTSTFKVLQRKFYPPGYYPEDNMTVLKDGRMVIGSPVFDAEDARQGKDGHLSWWSGQPASCFCALEVRWMEHQNVGRFFILFRIRIC